MLILPKNSFYSDQNSLVESNKVFRWLNLIFNWLYATDLFSMLKKPHVLDELQSNTSKSRAYKKSRKNGKV